MWWQSFFWKLLILLLGPFWRSFQWIDSFGKKLHSIVWVAWVTNMRCVKTFLEIGNYPDREFHLYLFHALHLYWVKIIASTTEALQSFFQLDFLCILIAYILYYYWGWPASYVFPFYTKGRFHKKDQVKSLVIHQNGGGGGSPRTKLYFWRKKKMVFRKIFRWILCLIKLGWLCELEVLVTLY